jgi:hypothetical protein
MERMADNLRQRDAARAPSPPDRATDLAATEPVVVAKPPTPRKAAPRRARADKAG